MTVEVVELESLLEDFSDEVCGVEMTLSWALLGRERKLGGECNRPAAFMIRTDCRGCGPHRRFICRRHLRLLRFKRPTCGHCGLELNWAKPGSGDAL